MRDTGFLFIHIFSEMLNPASVLGDSGTILWFCVLSVASYCGCMNVQLGPYLWFSLDKFWISLLSSTTSIQKKKKKCSQVRLDLSQINYWYMAYETNSPRVFRCNCDNWLHGQPEQMYNRPICLCVLWPLKIDIIGISKPPLQVKSMLLKLSWVVLLLER